MAAVPFVSALPAEAVVRSLLVVSAVPALLRIPPPVPNPPRLFPTTNPRHGLVGTRNRESSSYTTGSFFFFLPVLSLSSGKRVPFSREAERMLESSFTPIEVIDPSKAAFSAAERGRMVCCRDGKVCEGVLKDEEEGKGGVFKDKKVCERVGLRVRYLRGYINRQNGGVGRVGLREGRKKGGGGVSERGGGVWEGGVTFLCLFDGLLSARFGNRFNLNLFVLPLSLHVETDHVATPRVHFPVLIGLSGICQHIRPHPRLQKVDGRQTADIGLIHTGSLVHRS